jgi:phosphoenolpyruvate carboxykinase (GTP)
MIRVPESLAKIDRIMEIYKTQVIDAPKILFDTLDEQRERLISAQKKYGDYITPDKLT